MSLRLVFLLFCFLMGPRLFAQVGQTLYFKNFRPTDDSTHADYYRVMTAQNGDTFSYTEHYKDGSYLTATGKNGLASPVKVGEERHFYKNGKLAILNRYSSRGVLATSTGFYPNGILMYVEVAGGGPPPTFRIINYDADSSGRVHIVDGTGRRQETDSVQVPAYKIKERFILEGPYKNGVKEGTWKGRFENGWTFEEEYDAGKLVSGTSRSLNGKKYRYSSTFQYPNFGAQLDDFEKRVIPLLKNKGDTVGLVFIKPGYLQLNYIINEQGQIIDLKGKRKSDQQPVGLMLKKQLPEIEPEKIKGIPVPFIVVSNNDYFIRRNFKIQFDTYIQLNGQYKPPAQ